MIIIFTAALLEVEKSGGLIAKGASKVLNI